MREGVWFTTKGVIMCEFMCRLDCMRVGWSAALIKTNLVLCKLRSICGHGNTLPNRHGLPSPPHPPAVIVICGAITVQPEEREHFSEASRCPAWCVTSSRCLPAWAFARDGSDRGRVRSENETACFPPIGGGWREVEGFTLGWRGLFYECNEEKPTQRCEMKVERGVCWFTNWDIKIAVQLGAWWPGTMTKSEWQSEKKKNLNLDHQNTV